MENAFVLLGQFQGEAKRAGWDKKQIQKVMSQATSGNYDNLCATLLEAKYEIDEGVKE